MVSSQNDGRSAQQALTDRLYDSLVEFNRVAHWDILRLAQMRRYLAEHLANDLLAFYRSDFLNEAIEAARGEYLTDATGDETDEAYNRGVADVIAAIDALINGQDAAR